MARGTERVLDLGCGPGEWLLQALRDRPGVHGVGVDVSGTALDRAAGAARALDHPDHPDSAEALDAANGHRAAWLRGYRATWGFATLLLRRTAD
ncbi:methyltransferase domain-containing protein [Streptomyces sp. NPDC058874]|uniref:methyltransferase domain-containing protein n=1 Tax=unclassified Streptomyces TaxID=2593676 RepID=UPI0036B739F2